MVEIGSAQTEIDDMTTGSMQKSPKSLYFVFQMLLSFSQNLAFQYIPLFNKKLGADEIQMGLLTSVQNVFSTGFSPFFGRWSDVCGRKLFLITGAFIATTSAITMTLANTPTQVIVSVGVNSFGLSMIIPAWNGAIADYTKGQKRGGFIGRLLGASYGYVTIALLVYAFAAPLLPISEIEQYRLIIGISALNFGLTILVSWRIIDLRDPNKGTRKDSIFTPLRDRNYRNFLIVILFWWFWMSLAWSYFPTVIASVIEASVSEVAWIAVSATIVQAFASYKMGDLIDTMGPRKSIFLGFLSFSIIPINFAYATEWWHLIPAQMIGGIGIGFGFSALQTYIIEIAGSDRAGNYQGTYNLFWGIVTFIGSFLGGIILERMKVHFGSLEQALFWALLAVAIFRLLSNIIMYYYLPEAKSSISN